MADSETFFFRYRPARACTPRSSAPVAPRRTEIGGGLGDPRAVLGILQPRNDRVLLDEILDIEQDLLDLARGLCRDGGSIDGLDDTVESILARQGPILGDRRFQAAGLMGSAAWAPNVSSAAQAAGKMVERMVMKPVKY